MPYPRLSNLLQLGRHQECNAIITAGRHGNRDVTRSTPNSKIKIKTYFKFWFLNGCSIFFRFIALCLILRNAGLTIKNEFEKQHSTQFWRPYLPQNQYDHFFVGIISGVPKYNKLNLNYTYSTKHHAVAVPGNGGWHLLDERLAGDLVCQNRLRVLSFSFWLDIYICRVAFKTVID